MSDILGSLSRLITARPYVTLGILLIITVLLAAGAGQRAEPAETESFLPPGSAIANAVVEIDELFGEGELSVVTLIFRGDAFTPAGLSQMSALVSEIVADPEVTPLLAHTDPVISPALLIQAALGVDSFDAVTTAQIESVSSDPQVGAFIDAMSGVDADGATITITSVRLTDTGDERVDVAERRIYDLAAEDEGPLQASSLSPVVIEDEYVEATETGMLPLIGIALILIAALVLLFMRTISDLLLTLVGLLISLIWVVGIEGWLGPKGVGLIGPPSGITSMVPIIVISLTVDYAIQAVSHYREQRVAGVAALDAIRGGLRHVMIPITLAAVTTIVSLLASLFSPIQGIGDFGIVAGLGVGMSMIVMLTLIPAARTIIDRRREARGALEPARPIANALPGIERVAEVLGASVTRRPAPYFIVVIAITAGLAYASTGLESEFNVRDILPRGGSVLEDMETLDEAVGGATEMTSVLVKAEATETRTLLNLRDLQAAFADDQRRPQSAAGPIQASYETLLSDWVDDSGEAGDRFDPEMAALFADATAGLELDPSAMQQLLDQLEAQDPVAARNLVNDPDGVDSILLQFLTYTDDPETVRVLQSELDELWQGDDEAITATSGTLISVTVTDEIADSQTESISVTIAVALGILVIFFWVTLRQPALGVIAVAPIVVVLVWVLGTMALLGIPYSLITSIITALSIGIGVDYTIHMIHRYREEFSRLRNPEQAAVRTLATTGSALLGSALTTALGFGVLAASPLLASQQFGITAAITIAYALIVSIVVVPPAMTVWGAWQNMRLRSTMERMWEELDVAFDDADQRHQQEQSG